MWLRTAEISKGPSTGNGSRGSRVLTVLPRWQAGVATIAVTALVAALVILDIANRDVRRFWATHALTADTVAGLMVLGLTVLVVDQVLTRRQFAERSRVVAAPRPALYWDKPGGA
jgi:hypothetical protein